MEEKRNKNILGEKKIGNSKFPRHERDGCVERKFCMAGIQS